MGFLVFLGILIAIALFFVAIYNKLIALKERVANAWAQIDVQLQRRYDLIPNLVETAKGYMAHEKDTLEAVINARNSAVSAGQAAASNPSDPDAIKNVMAAEGQLTGALGRLFALAEAYPDLKANQTMEQLMEELATTENKISFARQAYNDAVMQYNVYQEQFPNNLVVNFFGGHAKAEMYEVEDEEAKKVVKVSFDN
ncbi:LemA family protein [Kangiella sp. HZ709]|uniref:LemA family protein n=1 Tax=Kangiella sp. HZ709 TaxID=2666328 RepID=UPI0012AFCA41|nr:LemA family protein [Kangiella sp. HZ709]MRX28637.1 LemA family protein [Kangiella sp. HZ709]